MTVTASKGKTIDKFGIYYEDAEGLLRAAQKMWARFWLQIVAVGFGSGIVIGICIGRIIEMHK